MTFHLTNLPSKAELDSSVVQPISAKPKTRFSLYRSAGKRLMDIALVVLAAPLVVPVVALMALLVARDGHNPFYSQKRVGLGGKSFRMWKMRSMVPNAHDKLEPYLAANPAARAEWEESQKLRNDPRITRVGRFLRKSSLDELPQLWNVLTGEMSLIGPRPMLPEQRVLYPGLGYYRLRPGITGLWQISDRNECAFHERAGFDDAYDQTLSLSGDVKILFSTVGVVLKATGH